MSTLEQQLAEVNKKLETLSTSVLEIQVYFTLFKEGFITT